MLLNKIRIAVIGTGKISHSLVSALTNAKLKPEIIISKSLLSAKNLADKFRINKWSNNFRDINSSINFFILSVPDSKIEDVSQKLSQLKLNFKNSYFIHLSGSLNISTLKSLQAKDGNTGSIHIMQTFPSIKVVSIKNIFASLEADNSTTEKLLFSFSRKIQLKPFKIDSNKKIFYHLAGVFTSNFLVANLFNAKTLFELSEISDLSFNKLMNPIIDRTFSNIKINGIENSLSGIIERGDLKTVILHIKILNEKKLSLLLNNYLWQSYSLLSLIKKKNKRLTSNQKKIQIIINSELLK